MGFRENRTIMYYTVRKGDSLWKVAARELNDSARWQEIAQLNQLRSPYLLYLGQTLRMPAKSKMTRPAAFFSSEPVCRVPSPVDNIVPASDAIKAILTEVDKSPELRGAAVVLQFPGKQTYQLRKSQHASGLETVVVAEIEIAEPADERSWWERWNGVVLNCGGAVVSWGSLGFSLAAEVPSLGTSTPLVVMSAMSAASTTAQCGLSVAAETNEDFQNFIQSEDGHYVEMADVVLDFISLAGGVGGAVAAVRSGGKLMNTSKYAKYLTAEGKGRLLKSLTRLEKAEKDLVYFREAVKKLVKSEKISNNIIKRSLPMITSSLNKEKLSVIGDVVAYAASVTSSYHGGVGPSGYGAVKVLVSVLQERIDAGK